MSQSGVDGGFSDASLKGSYAYGVGGYTFGASANIAYQRIGTFTADGTGHITAGMDDLIVAGGTLSTNTTTGTYAIAKDGTGVLSVTIGSSVLEFAITISSGGKVNMIDFDATESGAGQAALQDSTISSAPTGTFVFRFHSDRPNDFSPASVSAVGSMTFSAGSIAGNEDVVRVGALSSVSLTGTFTGPDSTGRGTGTITDSDGFVLNYVYRLIDSQTIIYMETDSGPVGSGRAEAQSGAFSNTTLNGSFVFRSWGDTLNHIDGINTAGVFTCDGNGNITTGNLDSVQDGVPTENATLNGSYSVEADGRVMLTLNPSLSSGPLTSIPEIMWMVSSSRAFFIKNVPGIAEDGIDDQQQGSSFSNSSLNGAYSFVMFGYDSQSPTEVDRVGLASFDGNSTLAFPNYFVNRSGSRDQLPAPSGTYTVSPNGRVQGTVPGVTNNLVIYLISNTSGDLILEDSGAEVSGGMVQQTSQ